MNNDHTTVMSNEDVNNSGASNDTGTSERPAFEKRSRNALLAGIIACALVLGGLVGYLIGDSAGQEKGYAEGYAAGTQLSPQAETEEALKQAESERAGAIMSFQKEKQRADSAERALEEAKDKKQEEERKAKEKEAKAKEEAAAAEAKKKTIREGTWNVGRDVEAGTYITEKEVSGLCYWEINVGNDIMDIIANDLPGGGIPEVTLTEGQTFKTNGCGTWKKIG